MARLVRHEPFLLAGVVWATLLLAGFPWGYDAHAYWLTRGAIAYRPTPIHDRYLYSPAFAEAIRPLTALPWPMFAALWSICAAAAYLWLTSGIAWRWRAPLLCACLTDVVMGNVWWLFSLVCVLGFRRPALWAIPLLTKVTPAVGVVWFAARREWRNAGLALACAGVIVAVSVVIEPAPWRSWVHLLLRGGGSGADPSLYPRLAAAAALAVWAARRGRTELLPVAVVLAAPIVAFGSLVVLAAVPRLLRERLQPSDERVLDLRPVHPRVEPVRIGRWRGVR